MIPAGRFESQDFASLAVSSYSCPWSGVLMYVRRRPLATIPVAEEVPILVGFSNVQTLVCGAIKPAAGDPVSHTKSVCASGILEERESQSEVL